MNQPYTVREFEIQDMLPIALTLIVAGIAMAFGLSVVGDSRDELGVDGCAAKTNGFTSYNASSQVCYNTSLAQQSVGTEEFNASVDAITGIAKLPKKMPLIATVVVAAIVIGILIRYLMVKYT